MVFTKRLRDGVRHGRITCSVRIWTRPHVKAGARYGMDEGHVVVDSIESIRLKDITSELARASGFRSVKDLLGTAKHGGGGNVYLIRFHYLPPGAWDVRRTSGEERTAERVVSGSHSSSSGPTQLLRRIRSSVPMNTTIPAKKGRFDE